MTDAQKLKYIENITREAFGEEWIKAPAEQRDSHRLQVIADVFAVFYYNGASVMPHLIPTEEAPEQTPKTKNNCAQITLFELMEV